jgi:Fe-S cluster assembly iron-binding protein IscA
MSLDETVNENDFPFEKEGIQFVIAESDVPNLDKTTLEEVTDLGYKFLEGKFI